MKTEGILIITHPLGFNYGGIAQAYALQKFVASMDPNIHVLTSSATRKRRKLSYIKQTINQSFRRRRVILDLPLIDQIVNKNTSSFINKHINTVNIQSNKDFRIDPQLFVERIIVGSDQVWRNAYGEAISYMLPFVDREIKKISYAASFGTGDLSEYNQQEVKQAKDLLSKFEAISVRESSGVEMCKNGFDLKAVQHIDPTLLLEKEDYIKLLEQDIEVTYKPEGELFSYILDASNDKDLILRKASKILNFKVYKIMPKNVVFGKDLFLNPHVYSLPPMAQWFRSFHDAKFVVTDSFHGCVFSIIFNKPFIAIGNEGRGMARFYSLLSLFGLEDRLVGSVNDVTERLIESKIDWKRVNIIRENEKNKSLSYLRTSLFDTKIEDNKHDA